MKVFIIMLIFIELLIFWVLHWQDSNIITPSIKNENNIKLENKKTDKEYVLEILKERKLKESFISLVSNSCIFMLSKENNWNILWQTNFNYNWRDVIFIYNIFTFNDNYVFTENNKDTIVHEAIHCYLNKDIKEFLEIKEMFSKIDTETFKKDFYLSQELVRRNLHKWNVNIFVHEIVAYTFMNRENLKEKGNLQSPYIKKIQEKIYQ